MYWLDAGADVALMSSGISLGVEGMVDIAGDFPH
jgi:hypothetical protein